MSVETDIDMTTDKLTFTEVNEVNAAFLTFEERRVKLIELLYGQHAHLRRWIPTKWLNEDSLIAAQSLVDTHVAKFELSPGDSIECIRPRRWFVPRLMSIQRLATQ